MIDALSFFGPYPFRRLSPGDLAGVAEVLARHGFRRAYVLYLPSLFYRDVYEGDREALELYRGSSGRLVIDTRLLAGINPVYTPLDKRSVEALVDGLFTAYVTSPTYNGYRLDSPAVLRSIERLCSEGARVVLIDLLEDLREMHRAYRLRYLVTRDVFKSFLRKIGVECRRRLMLSSFRYEIIREGIDRVSDLELYVDISSDTLYGYQYDRVRELVEALGPDLLVLSTRTPIAYPTASLYRVLYSEISERDKEKILWQNTERFYERGL